MESIPLTSTGSTLRLHSTPPAARATTGGDDHVATDRFDGLIWTYRNGFDRTLTRVPAATWAQPLFALMCDGVAQSVDHQIRHLLQRGANGRPRYYRFQVRLDVGNDDMDDTSRSNVRVLKLLAEDMILKNRRTLKELSGFLAEWSRAA